MKINIHAPAWLECGYLLALNYVCMIVNPPYKITL